VADDAKREDDETEEDLEEELKRLRSDREAGREQVEDARKGLRKIIEG